MSLLGRFASALIALLGPALLSAQQVTPVRPSAVPPAADTVLDVLGSARTDLRRLVTAQEAHYAQHGRYAATLEAINFKTAPGNTIRLVVAEANSWAASLTSARLRGDCVMFVNLPPERRPRSAADKLMPQEGVPLCDSQPETEGAKPVATPPASPERARINSARADLRNLVVAQEAFYSDRGRYAANIAQLMPAMYRPSEGTTIRLVNAEQDAWGAELKHPELSGTCTVWINLAESKRPRTSGGQLGAEGEPVCDAPKP